MGGVLSVPGGGPAVEDVVALAESNDVPYTLPLPVNEVRLRLFQFCFVYYYYWCLCNLIVVVVVKSLNSNF